MKQSAKSAAEKSGLRIIAALGDSPAPLEAIETAIFQIAEAGRKLLASKLQIRTIALLIKDDLKGKTGLKEIIQILEIAASLDVKHLKKEPKK